MACQSGLFRRLGRTRATGRPGGRGNLVQPAQRAQRVRSSVSALLVLPREVRHASNQQHVEASAEGQARGSRYGAMHRGSPVRRKAARSGRSQGADPSSVTPSGRIDCKPGGAACCRAHVVGQPHSARIRRSRTTTQVGVSHDMLSVLVTHRARDPPIGTTAGASALLSWGVQIRSYGALPAGARAGQSGR